MTASNISLALQQPSLLNSITVDELEKTITAFPFYTDAHIALAKKYQQENNQAFELQLQQAALYVYDRKKLYTLIEKTDITPEQNTIEEFISTETTANVYSDKLSITLVEETTIDVAPTPAVERLPYTTPEIVLNKLPETKTEEPVQEINSSHKAPDTQTPKSFTGWLQAFSKNDAATIKSAPLPAVVPTDNIPLEEPTVDYFSAELKQVDNNKIELITERLTKIQSPKLEDEDPTDIEDLKVDLQAISRSGLEQHEEFLTETMAQIYEMQGKPEKAIEVFEKLSLRLPEKSSLFAAQISRIKNTFQL